MKAEIINPFINAAINVISTMAFTEAKAGKPYLKKDTTATGDVSSLFGITGEKNGSVSISFDSASILQIVSKMFGEDIDKIDSEVAEAAGELANMISGQARQTLEETGYLFDGAIPSVITGDNHEITHITDGPKIAIPFTTDKGKFTMEICLEG